MGYKHFQLAQHIAVYACYDPGTPKIRQPKRHCQDMRKNILVLGANGFIGTNLCLRLKQQGHFVVGVDIRSNPFIEPPSDVNYIADLSDYQSLAGCFGIYQYDEIYQLAADMGGAGYIFTGENDANIMSNSAAININLLRLLVKINYTGKVFYSSSACIYPAEIQHSNDVVSLKEEDAYPANPDSEYGWEKLFSERLYLSFARNHKLNIRIARFHNIYGEYSSYNNGKEKAPAAMCRKVIETNEGGSIKIWGDGTQMRSFMYIDDCLSRVEALMDSGVKTPVNIGSSECVSIYDLAKLAVNISCKQLTIETQPEVKSIGVQSRNSDNSKYDYLIHPIPITPLSDGISKLYNWIKKQYELPPNH